MATISNLAVKIALNAAPLIAGAKAVANTMSDTSSAILPFNDSLAVTSKMADGVSDSIDEATSSIKGYVAAAVGAASVTAMMANAVREFAVAQDEATNAFTLGEDAIGRLNPPETLMLAWDRLGAAVNNANVIVGGTFASWAHLDDALKTLTNIVNNVGFWFSYLAAAAGAAFNFIANGPPIFMALAGALKIVAVALTIFVQLLFTRMLVGMVTYILLGKSYTVVTLAIAAAKFIAANATAIFTAAVWACNAALGVLAMLGAPIWLAIGIVIAGVLLVAIALYQIWQALAGADPAADKAARMEELRTMTQEATKGIDQMRDALDKAIRQDGMSDKEKELEAFAEELTHVRDLYGEVVAAELLAEHSANLDKRAAQKAHTEELKNQKKVTEALAEVDNAWYDRNLSDIEKKVLALRKLGANTEQLAVATKQLQDIEDKKKGDEERKTLAESIRDIEKEAAEAGLTATEKRVLAAKALHAEESDIARIRAAGAKIEANEQHKKKVDELAKAVDARQKEAKAINEAAEGPLDKFKRKMADIERLRKAGTLTSAQAAKAASAVEKDLKEDFKKDGKDFDSPKALLKGTAEAALAEDRFKNPVDKLTDIQRQALAEAKRMRAGIDALNSQKEKETQYLVDMQFD